MLTFLVSIFVTMRSVARAIQVIARRNDEMADNRVAIIRIFLHYRITYVADWDSWWVL
jgi:hypothetical protein